ncbi:MAG TPA: hypothetical protein VIT43_10985 [Candidatus Dormibacteraeota bacterium]
MTGTSRSRSLAADAKEILAVDRLAKVRHAQGTQLTDPHTGVRQDSDDELVTFRMGGILERLDLPSCQHIA